MTDAQDELLTHPGILDSFQTDLEFRAIHPPSHLAQKALAMTPSCIELAERTTRKVGLAGVDKICATGRKTQLMIFGLNVKAGPRPGPRIFGVLTPPSVQIDSVVNDVRAKIKSQVGT